MDDELKPMTDGDVTPASPDAGARAEAPVKDGASKPTAPADTGPQDAVDRASDAPVLGDAADAASTPVATPPLPTSLAEARQQLKDGTDRVSQQVTDKARGLVGDGKERATDALGQLSQMLRDAADQVDGKLGEQYGRYARDAAGTVQGFADQVRDKPVDELLDDARALVRKSPGVALGAAAAVGFVIARLASAAIDQRGA